MPSAKLALRRMRTITAAKLLQMSHAAPGSAQGCHSRSACRDTRDNRDACNVGFQSQPRWWSAPKRKRGRQSHTALCRPRQSNRRLCGGEATSVPRAGSSPAIPPCSPRNPKAEWMQGGDWVEGKSRGRPGGSAGSGGTHCCAYRPLFKHGGLGEPYVCRSAAIVTGPRLVQTDRAPLTRPGKHITTITRHDRPHSASFRPPWIP